MLGLGDLDITDLSRQGHLEQETQEHVQVGLGSQQGHSTLPGQLLPCSMESSLSR